MFVMMVAIVPFTLFYYEQDHDMSVWGKTVSSSWWIGGTITVLALILGLCYGFLGFVDFPVTTLTSGLAPLSSAALTTAHKCLAPRRLHRRRHERRVRVRRGRRRTLRDVVRSNHVSGVRNRRRIRVIVGHLHRLRRRRGQRGAHRFDQSLSGPTEEDDRQVGVHSDRGEDRGGDEGGRRGRPVGATRRTGIGQDEKNSKGARGDQQKAVAAGR